MSSNDSYSKLPQSSKQSQLPLPPFGRVLQAYIDEGIYKIPRIEIYIGRNAKVKAHNEKKWGDMCCYLPYGDSFVSYKWPVSGQNIMIIDVGDVSDNFIRSMSIHLFSHCNAHTVMSNPNRNIFYLTKEKHNER